MVMNFNIWLCKMCILQTEIANKEQHQSVWNQLQEQQQEHIFQERYHTFLSAFYQVSYSCNFDVLDDYSKGEVKFEKK